MTNRNTPTDRNLSTRPPVPVTVSPHADAGPGRPSGFTTHLPSGLRPGAQPLQPHQHQLHSTLMHHHNPTPTTAPHPNGGAGSAGGGAGLVLSPVQLMQQQQLNGFAAFGAAQPPASDSSTPSSYAGGGPTTASQRQSPSITFAALHEYFGRAIRRDLRAHWERESPQLIAI